MEKLAITMVAGFFRCSYRQADQPILALFYPLKLPKIVCFAVVIAVVIAVVDSSGC